MSVIELSWIAKKGGASSEKLGGLEKRPSNDSEQLKVDEMVRGNCTSAN